MMAPAMEPPSELLTRDEIWESLDAETPLENAVETFDADDFAEADAPDAELSAVIGSALADDAAADAGESAPIADAEVESNLDAATDGAEPEDAETATASAEDAFDAELAAKFADLEASDATTTDAATGAANGAANGADDAPLPEWVDVKDDSAPSLDADQAQDIDLDEDIAAARKSVRLSFGDTGGLDETREAKLADVPPAPPETPLAPAEAAALFEETEEPEAFAFAEASGDFTPQKPVEPLVLTTEMTVAMTRSAGSARNSTAMIDPVTPDSNERTTTETPVLRLVEAVETADDDGTPEDAEIHALRQFADRAGASTLPDLLEASAAFVTLVDGKPSFSRGEILRLLDTISDGGAFSQEARIKSFGALLRGGRIQRIENGEFEMSRKARANYEEAAASAI